MTITVQFTVCNADWKHLLIQHVYLAPTMDQAFIIQSAKDTAMEIPLFHIAYVLVNFWMCSSEDLMTKAFDLSWHTWEIAVFHFQHKFHSSL